MKLLHTSDWHLGRALYGRRRDKEFSAFLNWLLETLRNEDIDILLISGDIFDTTTPSNWAQTLYFSFLTRIRETGCKHVVITAGNHDSATFLEAPAGILKSLNIHVVGATDGDTGKEVIPIHDEQDFLKCVICAVPYLREKDIRSSSPGESVEEKSQKLVQAIERHYHDVVTNARAVMNDNSRVVPLIAMGHLFAAGGKSVKGDGVRDLYVGSLAHVPASIFPDAIDYLALGHLHRAQLVAGQETTRYSGSPLAMSFEEAKQPKQIVLVAFSNTINSIAQRVVPCFQTLLTLSGNLAELKEQLESLKDEDSSIWLEIHYTGKEIETSLHEDLGQIVKGSKLEILRIVNKRIIAKYLDSKEKTEDLEQLSIEEVFTKCLTQNEVDPSDKAELLLRFHKAVETLEQEELRQ